MKPDHRKKAGLLQPILVSTKKWEQITTDLVTHLPPSTKYIDIDVFANRLTKMVHFAPCIREIIADQRCESTAMGPNGNGRFNKMGKAVAPISVASSIGNRCSCH